MKWKRIKHADGVITWVCGDLRIIRVMWDMGTGDDCYTVPQYVLEGFGRFSRLTNAKRFAAHHVLGVPSVS